MNKKRTVAVAEPDPVEPPAGVYVPQPGEKVRVSGMKGARFEFLRYGRDQGGVYAVVLGGPSGHTLERCVKPERIMKTRR